MTLLPIPADLLTYQGATTEEVLSRRDAIIADAQRCMAVGDVSSAVDALRRLASATIDEQTLERTDPYLSTIVGSRKVVASFDQDRVPGPDEVVIIYGNYPHSFDNVVANNPVRRHVADFWSFAHDRVESDKRWDGIDQLLLINLDSRRDRLDAVLRELASAAAPLDRLTRVAACRSTGTSQAEGQVACLKSHIRVLEQAQACQYRHVLVLEDDFCFTSDLEVHLVDLERFYARNYDYWICLIATSKYGEIVPIDDLLAVSLQRCTNTGGYLASKTGIDQLLPVYRKALTQLEATGDCVTNAVDRCWSVLQPSGKFVVFRRKFGFQVSSYSNIEHSVSRYLD